MSYRHLTIIIVSIILSFKVHSQVFTSDTTFAPTIYGNYNGDGISNGIRVSTYQTDGKLIIGGVFTEIDGVPINCIARLLPNGNLDPTFTSSLENYSDISRVIVQPDGKILIAGAIYENGTPNLPLQSTPIVRLNSNGTIDNSFNTNMISDIHCMALLPSGKIMVGGSFSISTTQYNGVARLNTDGIIDYSFGNGVGTLGFVREIKIDASGKILVAGSFNDFNNQLHSGFVRILADGAIDPSFHVPPTNLFNEVVFTSIGIQSNGKYILAGRVVDLNSTFQLVYRFNTNGTIDSSFISDGMYYDMVETCAILSNDKILIGGDINGYNGQQVKYLCRLNVDGILDQSYSSINQLNNVVKDIDITNSDSVVLSGFFTKFDYRDRKYLLKLNPNGTINDDYRNNEGFNNDVNQLKISSLNTVYAVGKFTYFENTPANRIISLNLDGSINTAFNSGEGFDNDVKAIFIESSGKIILGGDFTKYNGTSISYLCRLNIDGTLDNSFNVVVNGPINSIERLPNGNYYLAGNFTTVNGVTRNRIAHISASNILESNFNGSGFNGEVKGVKINSQGKLLIHGNFTTYNSYSANRIVVLNPSGFIYNDLMNINAIDATYANFVNDTLFILSQSVVGESSNFYSINNQYYPYTYNLSVQAINKYYVSNSQILPDGQLLLHGEFDYYDANNIHRHVSTIRTNYLSEPEYGFESEFGGLILSSEKLPNGKQLVAGKFGAISSIEKNRIAVMETCTEMHIQTISACPPFTWIDGNTYTSSTDSPIVVLQNSLGCDSIIQLHLTIYSNTSTIDTLVYDDHFYWSYADDTLYQSGTYSHNSITSTGCDSTVILNLTLMPSINYTISENIHTISGTARCIEVDSVNNTVLIGGTLSGINQIGELMVVADSLGKCTTVLKKEDFVIDQASIFSNFDVFEDGNGGFYVFGHFNKYKDSLRPGAMQLDSNLNITAWKPQSIVPALLKFKTNDTIIYGIYNQTLYTIDKLSGQVQTSNFSLASISIYDYQIIGNHIAIAGNYSGSVGIKLFHLQTGISSNVSISTGTNVYKMLAINNALYVCGNFTYIAGSYRTGMVRLDYNGTNLSLGSWFPLVNGPVADFIPVGNQFYLTGSFTTCQSQARNGAANIAISNATIGSFNPGVSGKLFFGGGTKIVFRFLSPVTINGRQRDKYAVFDALTNQLDTLDVKANFAQYNVIDFNGKPAFVFYSLLDIDYGYCGFINARALITLDATTSEVLPNPINFGPLDQIDKIYHTPYGWVFYGFFQGTNGYKTIRFFDQSFNEFEINDFYAYSYASEIKNRVVGCFDEYVYIINGANTSYTNLPYFSRINLATQSIDYSLNLEIDSTYQIQMIHAMVKIDSLIYVSGQFNYVQGVPKKNLFAFNPVSLQLSSFELEQNGTDFYAFSMETEDDKLLLSGNYDNYQGLNNKFFIKADVQDEIILPWLDRDTINNSMNNVSKLKHYSNLLFIGGYFSSICNLNHKSLAIFLPGAKIPLEPEINSFNPNLLDFVYHNNRLHTLIDSSVYFNGNTYLPKTKYRYFDFCINTSILKDTLINNNAYVWFGDTITSPGTYYKTIPSQSSCDSICVLQLVDVLIEDDTIVVNSCDQFLWDLNNQFYDTTGIYSYQTNYLSISDTVYYLDLHIHSSSLDTVSITACNQYFWNTTNQFYFQTGVYTWNGQSAFGCDSTIVLDLTILNTGPLTMTSYSLPSSDSVCNGMLALNTNGNNEYFISIDATTPQDTSSGYILLDSLCPGIHSLMVTTVCPDTLIETIVIPLDSNYVFNNPFLDSLALDSLSLTNTNCTIYYNSIDTAFIDSLWMNNNVLNIVWNIIDVNGSNFDTATYTLNNGYGVYWLQLNIFCPSKALDDFYSLNLAYYFGPVSPSTNGILIHDKGDVIYYPNPTNGNIHILSDQPIKTIQLIDNNGRLIKQFQDTNQIDISEFEAGSYLLLLNVEDQYYIRRVIKQ